MTDHASFARLATLATHRKGVETARVVLAVNDGAEWIQDLLDVQCPEAIRILDWAHASGYLHAAGHAVFADTCGQWCAEQLRKLLTGAPIAVLVELVRLLDLLPEDAQARETVSQSLAYLAKRYEQIQYATFTALGYPIGSGIVESANKLVVQARLKGAGMHWSRLNVDPMLALRSIVCSDRWDAAWPSISGQRRYAARHRRVRRHDQRRAQRPSRQSRPPRPPRAIAGRPTQQHPWKRIPAVHTPPRKTLNRTLTSPIAYPAWIAGTHGVVAVLAALHERQLSGKGQQIELGQVEMAVATVGALLRDYFANGTPPERLGNRSMNRAPQGVYRAWDRAGRASAADTWVALSVQSDAQWQQLCVVAGLPGLMRMYPTLDSRLAAHDAIDVAIAS